METQPSTGPHKPEWLKNLEEESWQAELIISGIAIYGTLQIPDLVEWLLDWCLATVDDSFFKLLYLFFTYLGLGAYMLILIFIAHFVLRTVWIGLVGLNSVYPHGINEQSESYAQHFIRQFRADHLDEQSRISQLDDLCSVLFGFGAQLIMVFMAVNLDILILGVIWYILENLFGSLVSNIFGITMLAIFVGYTLIFLISNTKKLREKPFIKKWQYPVYKRLTGILMHVFARPASYLGMVFQTNLSVKRYAGMVLLMTMFVLIFFGSRFLNYRFIGFVRPDALYGHFDRSDRLVPEHYANLRSDDRRLLSLELESDKITGETMRVFIPILGSESSNIQGLCGELPDQGTREALTDKRRAYYSDCYREMHRFYINDRPYTDVDMIKFEHPNQTEPGILAYFSTERFQNGKNVLRVEKIAPEPEAVYRQMQAVFWYEAGN